MIAILVGLVAPGVAVAVYFAIALYMILFREIHGIHSAPVGPPGERRLRG